MPEETLPKPITVAAIKRARGILKKEPVEKPFRHALQAEMEQKAKEFAEKGGEVYVAG